MEISAIFTTAFIVGFSGAMMPGPLLTVTIGESARRGFKAGPLIVLGHAFLELALILALAGGLSVLLTTPRVSQTIAVLGGAFLLYMGAGMARDAAAGRVSLKMSDQAGQEVNHSNSGGISPGTGHAAAQKRMHPVLAGILVSVSNPYWTLWWATVGLGYITLSLQKGTLGLTSFFTGHILADLVWYSLISAAVAGGRKFLSDRIYGGIITACGIFLIGLGIYFLYYGLFT
ncbi:LysE family transporter [Pelotomaculum propionicicum]|uniref:LysE family transporter n=1 Tax=Pelotomaculum propionicicum TaxID=258475 RepID=UPI003B7B8374